MSMTHNQRVKDEERVHWTRVSNLQQCAVRGTAFICKTVKQPIASTGIQTCSSDNFCPENHGVLTVYPARHKGVTDIQRQTEEISNHPMMMMSAYSNPYYPWKAVC